MNREKGKDKREKREEGSGGENWFKLSGIVLNRKRISTKKEVLLVLTGLRKTPKREREKRREREIARMREREMMITTQYII